MAAPVEQAVLINGEPSSSLSVQDRGLQYGHGLFETIAIRNGQPQHWEKHVDRLLKGCRQLKIKTPELSLLHSEVIQLAVDKERAVIKILYTAGTSGRGYRISESHEPNRIISLTPWPDYPDDNYHNGITIRLCAMRLGRNPHLAGIKHLNRLEQVLARSEWNDCGISEGLMLDTQGFLIEGTMSNVFFVKNNTLCTPGLEQCGIAGVMRDIILSLAESLSIKVYIDEFTPSDLFQADEVFMTNSLIGIWPVSKIVVEENIYFDSPGKITRRLQRQLKHNNYS